MNTLFSLFILSIAAWCFGAYVVNITPSPETALRWVRIFHIAAVFPPPLSIDFLYAVTGRNRSSIRWVYFPSIVFLLLVFTPQFITGVAPAPYIGFSYTTGVAYVPFMVFFFSATLYGLWVIYYGYRTSTGHKRSQLRYFLFAFSVIFTGSIIYFLLSIRSDLPIPPVDNFFIVLFVSIIAYAILRYNLMDIKVALTRAAIFAFVYAPLLVLPFVIGKMLESTLSASFGANWWMLPMAVEAIFAAGGLVAYRYVQKKAEDRLLADERKAHEALRFISQDMMRFLREKTLLRQIVRRLVSTLHISHAAIYLAEGENGHYRRKTTWHSPPRKDTALPEVLPADSTLAKDLVTVRIPRVKEELKLHQQALSGNWREMTRNLDALQASVVIPTFHQRRFLGFLILGDKRSGRIWTQDDLNLLMVLANQAALAIENARFHEAEEAKMVERERDQMALDISSAVSHQYSNRLQVIENLCWQSMTWLQEMLKKEAFDLAKMTRILRTFESIRKECARGGEIAKGIMSLAKTIPAEFQPAELPPMVRDAIEFVTFKHTRGKVVEEAEIPEIVNGLPPNLPKVSCNSAQVHDSIMNVIDNAVDAIEERIRKMRLKVLPLPPEPYKGRVVVKAQAQNGKIVITVEDNGIGIREEDKRKVFVPLFTTKGSSQGTGPGGHGLGLFYIKRILMAHGGRITVESEYGKGACFTIELPALKEDEASHAA